MPILWTVYQPPYDAAGRRFVIVRTAKSLSYISVKSDGDYWRVARYRRPLAYDWSFDEWTVEQDFRVAMQKVWKEKPRLRQMDLALEWPPEPPPIIQLQFCFDFKMAA